MNALETKIAELVAWKAASVRLRCTDHYGQIAAEVGGTTATVLHAPGTSSLGVYMRPGEMDAEPEFQAAWAKVQEAVQGLHDAREAIIRRKALELANVVHGEQLNGIRALVDQIQEGAGS